MKIRSKGRSDNFTKYVIAKCDLECSIIYDTAVSIYQEESCQKQLHLPTCQSLRISFFFQSQLLLSSSIDSYANMHTHQDMRKAYYFCLRLSLAYSSNVPI